MTEAKTEGTSVFQKAFQEARCSGNERDLMLIKLLTGELTAEEADDFMKEHAVKAPAGHWILPTLHLNRPPEDSKVHESVEKTEGKLSLSMLRADPDVMLIGDDVDLTVGRCFHSEVPMTCGHPVQVTPCAPESMQVGGGHAIEPQLGFMDAYQRRFQKAVTELSQMHAGNIQESVERVRKWAAERLETAKQGVGNTGHPVSTSTSSEPVAQAFQRLRAATDISSIHAGDTTEFVAQMAIPEELACTSEKQKT